MWKGAQCFVPTTRASFEHDADFLRALQGFISDGPGITFKHYKGSFRTTPGFLSGITWVPFTARIFFLTRHGCRGSPQAQALSFAPSIPITKRAKPPKQHHLNFHFGVVFWALDVSLDVSWQSVWGCWATSQIKARAPLGAQNEASSPLGAKGELASICQIREGRMISYTASVNFNITSGES